MPTTIIRRISAVTALDGRRVRVTWRGGGEKIADLAPLLESRRIFIPLREDDALFRRMSVSAFGDAIVWPGPDLECSAVWLDRLPDDGFENADFRAAMDRLHLSLDGMAAAPFHAYPATVEGRHGGNARQGLSDSDDVIFR